MPKNDRMKRLREFVWLRDGYRCQYCGVSVAALGEATADHIIPSSLGGEDVADNLRTACRPCNSTKKDNSVEWFRMFLAMGRTRYANVITLEQYHRLRGLGVALEPLETLPFFFESQPIER